MRRQDHAVPRSFYSPPCIRSGGKKHSRCVACQDKCMQGKGIWPLVYLGKPCG